MGILSEETVLANHPWVDDPQEELKRLKAQKKEAVKQFGAAYGSQDDGDEE